MKKIIIVFGIWGVGKCIVMDRDSDFVLDSLGNLIKIKDKPKEVFVMDSNFKLKKAKVKNYYNREVNNVLEIITKTNKKIFLTPEHPLFTLNGWKKANQLNIKDYIATPRIYNLNLTKTIEKYKVKLLAYLIAEGGITTNITFTNTDSKIIKDFKNSISKFDNNLYIRQKKGNIGLHVYNGKRGWNLHQKKNHSLIQYLRDLKLFGCNSEKKFIPREILQLSNKQIGLFLSILFSCDGYIGKKEISYCSKSEVLIRQVSHLLLRFGIISSIHIKNKCATNTIKKIKRTYYELTITNQERIQIFINKINVINNFKIQKLKNLQKYINSKEKNNNLDTIPKEIWNIFRPKSWINFGKKLGYKMPKSVRGKISWGISREKLNILANLENNAYLKKLSNSDIFWDKIKSIKKIKGNFQVYDLEMDHPNHNFIANDIIVHNSYYCENFIKAHPEFEICNADTPIEELAKKKWVIMDYWFNKDWNANKLRKTLNPEVGVEIGVIYDDPEEITRRQVYLKENDQDVNLYASINLYSKDLKELIYMPDAKYFYKENEITFEEFKLKIYENRKPYSKEQILKHIEWMKSQKGYDWQYHEMDFPYGIHIGKEGYSRNKAEWEVLKDLIDWKGKSVVDLAGNNGYFCQEIWLKGGNPTLVDIHLDVLYSAAIIARIKQMDFKIIKKDLNTGFPNGHFDIALCMNVLHHIKNQELLFDHLKNLPLVLFAINRQDVDKIDKYFNFIRVLNSPKENRIFCLVKPK